MKPNNFPRQALGIISFTPTYALLPDDDTILQRGDRILMCGRFGTEQQAEWVARNHSRHSL